MQKLHSNETNQLLTVTVTSLAATLIAIFALIPMLVSAQENDGSVENKLNTAADEVVGDHDEVDVQYDDDSQKATLTVKDEQVFSGASAIRDTYEYFAGWGEKVNDLDGVKTLEVDMHTTFTDQMGEQDMETLVRITMNVDNFNEFNWENLEGQPIHNQLRQKGNLYIHPATARDVDLEEDTYLTYSSDSDEGCFVATAAYGTPAAEDIEVLREFRDTRLKGNPVGETFVDFYYEHGPDAAEYISDKDYLRYYFREFQIKPVAGMLERTESIWQTQ